MKTRAWIYAAVLTLAAPTAFSTEITLKSPGLDDRTNGFLVDASLTVQANSSPDSTPQDLIAAARADYARLLSVLYDLGFYSGVITIRIDGREAAEISPLASPGSIDDIDITVLSGPVFNFSEAQLRPLSPKTELPELFRAGSRAFAGVIEEAAIEGVEGWRRVGHAKARVVEQRITANHREETLGAFLLVDPGPRLTFGDLVVTSESRVRQQRILEIAGLPSGDVFSPEEVEKAARRLRRTGAFRSVVLNEAEEIGPGDTLDIEAQLTDAKRRRVGIGIEIFSLEGLTFSGFWLHRNLLGGAERLRVDAEVSGIGGDSGGEDYTLSTRFDRPATFNTDTALYLEGELEHLDEPDFTSTTARAEGGFSYTFSDELTGEIGLAYQYSDITDDVGSRTLEHLMLPARLTFDNRDNEFDATKGWYADLQITPFLGLDNDAAGARVYSDLRHYRSFGEDDDYTIAARVQAGSIAGAKLTEIPPDMLFFSGGAGTVRGQGYQSLAVDLGGGNRLGGRSFLALSAELRADLWGSWSVVGFADTGFVGEGSLGENGDWHSGAGFGVRYNTGFGPIRVDLATPLDDDAGKKFELYVGIGQAF